MVSAGDDWSQPYSCSQWAATFNLTFPILNDDDASMYGLFGIGYVPHNVIIDHTGIVLYSQPGANIESMIDIVVDALDAMDMDGDGIPNNIDNCIQNFNPYQEDTDNDSIGDACDDCDNILFSNGNINGDSILDIFDVLMLVDVLIDGTDNQCILDGSDVNNDGTINTIDVIRLVQKIFDINEEQAIEFLRSTLLKEKYNTLFDSKDFILKIYPNPSNGQLTIVGSGNINIFNVKGQYIKTINIHNQFRLDTNDMPSGIYYFQSQTELVKVVLLK